MFVFHSLLVPFTPSMPYHTTPYHVCNHVSKTRHLRLALDQMDEHCGGEPSARRRQRSEHECCYTQRKRGNPGGIHSRYYVLHAHIRTHIHTHTPTYAHTYIRTHAIHTFVKGTVFAVIEAIEEPSAGMESIGLRVGGRECMRREDFSR